MANDKIMLEVVTPARAVLKTTVSEVILPGIEGQLGVLPGHLPLLTALDDGEMIIHTSEGKRSFVLDSGFAEILREKVTVLTEECHGIEEIDVEHARQLREEAEQDVKRLEELSRTEPVEEEVLEHHRKMLRRAQTRLLLGERGGKN